MKEKNLSFLILVLVLGLIAALAIPSVAQDNTTKVNTTQHGFWLESMQDPNVNFYELQSAFNKYWEIRTDYKGNGYKVFRRWEYINESRVLPDGRLQAPDYVMDEYNRYMKEVEAAKSLSGNWTIVGPTAYPANNTSQPTGMGRINAIAFHPTDANIIYVGSPSGGFWKTTSGGSTWTNLSSDLPTLGVSSILTHPSDPDIIYIGSGDRDSDDAEPLGVFKSTDGGATWTQINNTMGDVIVGAMVMHPSSPNTIVAATSGGIYKTTDGGATWSLKTSGNFKDIKFKPGDPTVVYAVKIETPSTFYRSSDTGDSWTQITSGIPTSGIGSRMVIGVSSANANYVYLVQIKAADKNFAGLLRSTDGGLNFSTQSTTPNIFDYACDGSGTASQATYDLCITVDPSDEDIVYIGGINNWKSTDGGVNWTIVSHWLGSSYGTMCAASVHADQHCFEWSPLNGRLFVGHDGGISYTADGGSTWPEITGNMAITQIYKIGQGASNTNYSLFGCQDNGSAATTNGSTFTTTYGGDGTECIIDFSNSNYCYNTYVEGDIHRSTAGPTGSYSTIATTGTHGIGADESGAWVTPYFLHETNASVMFAGYENVWRCDNIKASPSSSVTWSAISSGETTTCKVLEQSPANVDIVYVVRSGAMKRSDNANASAGSVTWTACTLPGGDTPTDLEAHPTDEDIVYATAGYKIYKSTDKGASWSDISGNLPALNINCLVYDENSTEGLYIGNQTSVWFKNASMPYWVLFSNGLPPVDVRELEIYYDATPANNRIKAGTYGRGLWQSDLIDVYVIDPTGLTASVASSTQIDLAWTKNVSNNDVMIAWSSTSVFGTPVNGYSYSGGNSITGGGTVIYNSSGTSFNHTSLSPSTTYYYKAWSVNGSSEYSYGITANETTDCPSITSFPFTENFDDPSCWKTIDNTGDGNWQFGTFANGITGTGDYAYLDSDGYGSGKTQDADLISPTFDCSAFSSIALEFKHYFRQYSVSSGKVYYSIDNGVNWVLLANYTSTTTNPATALFSIGAAAGQSQVRFKWNYSGSWEYYWSMDDVEVYDNANQWTGGTDNDWFKVGNWGSGSVPIASDAVDIPSAPENQPQINDAGAVCSNLTIQTGASLTMNGSTSYTLSVSGDWINNGTFNRGIGTVDFVGTNLLQTIKGSSTTAFNILKVTKGAQDRILEATSLITLNAATNPLVITSGTFKLSSASTLTPFTTSTTIGSTAGFWNNGGTLNAGAFSWTLNGGLLRISAGTVNVGTSSDNRITYMNNGKLTSEGGALNIAGRFSPNSGTSTGTFIQSGGIITVNIVGSTAIDRAPFEINTGVPFTMSNGTIVIQKVSSNTTADYINLATTNTVTGGTLQIGNASTPASQTIRINSTVPIYNLTVNSTNSPTAQLVTSGLTVSNDVTIVGGTLNANDLNLNVGGNWANNGTFTAGSGMVTFSGAATQNLGGSSSTTFSNLVIGGSDVILANTSSPALTTVSNALTINNGKKLTVPANKTLTVNGTLTNSAGTSGLVIESDATGTGSIIHSTTDVNGTFERYMNNADWSNWQDGWHFLSSPVVTQAINPAFTTAPYDFFCWYEPENLWVNFKNTTEAPTWNTANGSTNFTLGNGYMAAYDEGDTKLFSGLLNVGNVNATGLTKSSENHGWHLLGNPFGSAITWDASGDWSLSNIAGVAKIWNETNQSYSDLTSSPSSIIPATNGFMVRVSSGTGSLVLPAAKRVHDATAFYKTSTEGITLKAVSITEGNAQESRIILNPVSTETFDVMFDGEFLKGHAPELYSVSGDRKLSTNSLPEITSGREIMFGFVKNTGNEFRIEAEGTESMQIEVYLHDLKTGIVTDLHQQPVYTFNAYDGDNAIRFKLMFGEQSTQEQEVKAYFSQNILNLVNTQGEILVEIFGLTGQKLLQTTTTNSSIMFNHSTGIYLVRVTTQEQVTNFKLFKY